MGLKLELIEAKDIIRTTPEGAVDHERVKEILAKIASAQNVPPDHVIMIDARKTKAKLSTTDVWYLAAELHRQREAFNRKSALLVPAEDFDLASFFELCAQNRGFSVNAFTDFEAAINWLTTSTDLD